MTGRDLCGVYVVAVPDEYKMYARKEAERNHSKKASAKKIPPSLFLVCQKTSQY